MSEWMKSFNHGTGPVDLSDRHFVCELAPIELHRKENGAIGDKPSYCFVLQDLFGNLFYAQVSEETLSTAIRESQP